MRLVDIYNFFVNNNRHRIRDELAKVDLLVLQQIMRFLS